MDSEVAIELQMDEGTARQIEIDRSLDRQGCREIDSKKREIGR